MKNTLSIFFFTILLCACKNKVENSTKTETTKQEEIKQTDYKSFGEKISDADVLSKNDMATKYANLKEGDTIAVKFTSSINEVCKVKGCWMKLDLGKTTEDAMVRFKDYGFFMPIDSDNKQVIVKGRAYVAITPVDELKHYAEDAGKSKEEIAKITAPKKTLAFEADGVLLRD